MNPHVFPETRTQYPEQINVWAGLLGNCIVVHRTKFNWGTLFGYAGKYY